MSNLKEKLRTSGLDQLDRELEQIDKEDLLKSLNELLQLLMFGKRFSIEEHYKRIKNAQALLGNLVADYESDDSYDESTG